MVQSMTVGHLDPEIAKQPQTITKQPPCLTVGPIFLFVLL